MSDRYRAPRENPSHENLARFKEEVLRQRMMVAMLELLSKSEPMTIMQVLEKRAAQ